MQQKKKEIEELYFIDLTSDYVVVNDQYQGVLILDYDFNIIKSLKLSDDIIISHSITFDNKMLLFCYENECVFFVDLDLWEIKRIEMNMFPDVYFSDLFEWNSDYVYLFGNNGETCIKITLASGIAEEVLSSSENELKDCFKKLWKFNVCAYDSINSVVLIIQDSEYILFDYKNGAPVFLRGLPHGGMGSSRNTRTCLTPFPLTLHFFLCQSAGLSGRRKLLFPLVSLLLRRGFHK